MIQRFCDERGLRVDGFCPHCRRGDRLAIVGLSDDAGLFRGVSSEQAGNEFDRVRGVMMASAQACSVCILCLRCHCVLSRCLAAWL